MSGSERFLKKITTFLAKLPLVLDLYRTSAPAQTTRHLKGGDYYNEIAQGSQKLQNQVVDLICHLEFSTEHSEEKLAKAIRFFQQKDSLLTGAVPTDFIKPSELANIRDTEDKLRVSLYKALLAKHIMRGFKARSVYMPTSHQYKSMDD